MMDGGGGASPTLSGFLRDRRARLPPEPGARSRRRTPGLRREEVATRAGVSVTWYTWLEQGRGGPPSAEVLERLARALELDAAGRDLLFVLAQHRPPPLRPAPPAPMPPALQRVLDAMPASPALVKTPAWDIVAWNAAAAAVLGDYGAVPASERNALRRLFGGDAEIRARLPDWESNARFALGVFRADVARGGPNSAAARLADELLGASPDFRRLWAENGVGDYRHHLKRMVHPVAGPLTLECSAFAADGATGLSLLVFTAATAADAAAVAALLEVRPGAR